jgi:hypothetical protein
MIGKAKGQPVTLGSAPLRSERLASAVRLMPADRRTPPTDWIGSYAPQTDVPDVAGPPWGAAEQV